MNRRPKSSNVSPNWDPPSAASQASPSGRKRKSVRWSTTAGRSGAAGRHDLPSRQSAGQVDPVVDREGRVADAKLGAPARREAREEDPPLVGLAVAVGVAEIEHIRGARDDQPPFQGMTPLGNVSPRRTRRGGPCGRRRRCPRATRSCRPGAHPPLDPWDTRGSRRRTSGRARRMPWPPGWRRAARPRPVPGGRPGSI